MWPAQLTFLFTVAMFDNWQISKDSMGNSAEDKETHHLEHVHSKVLGKKGYALARSKWTGER